MPRKETLGYNVDVELIRSTQVRKSTGKVTTTLVTDWYGVGNDIIEYADGKKLPSGVWPWKQCYHTWTRTGTPLVGVTRGVWEDGNYVTTFAENVYSWVKPRTLPIGSWDDSCLANINSQIDLNSSDAVLLYSGVIQAVPFVGSVLKLTSMLNRAARNLSKSFRKKPFTTVVKSLISADFVDRFVISPTIDDARKFADATNYVLRVIDTARERNSHRFALSSEVKTLVDKTEKTVTGFNQGSYSGTYRFKVTDSRTLVSKAFALLEVSYDMTAVSPIKLWAQRVGLTRPLDSVWDLVPFSFVLDYFTRAGDFISYLSDEMSSVEGLRGKIMSIHDLWLTFARKSEIKFTDASMTKNPWFNRPDWNTLTFEPNQGSRVSGQFTRKRIDDPWGALLSHQRKVSDYLTVSLNPSSTQKRTIAELVIQAKL